MSRHVNKKVERKPDPTYNSKLVRQFACMLMKDGKFNKAYKHLCVALEETVKKNSPAESVPKAGSEEMVKAVHDLLEELIEKAGPEVEVKSKRVGGATYPVPVVVKRERKISLAFRWIIKFSRKKVGALSQCLMQEFADILAGKGGTITEKENLYKMAKANMAFAGINKR